MPVVTYETLFLLDSNKVSSDAEGAKNSLHHIIERVGGHVEVSRPWDYNHKLTYPIHKSKKGAFHIIYYTLESRKQADLEREFKLNPDLIYRHMTLNIDPKWLEIVMGVARDDHGTGFAVRGMHEEGSSDPTSLGLPPSEGGEGEMAGGPRRGGRRFDSEKPE
jgi:small subunit ribosomal protein S6